MKGQFSMSDMIIVMLNIFVLGAVIFPILVPQIDTLVGALDPSDVTGIMLARLIPTVILLAVINGIWSYGKSWYESRRQVYSE